MLESGLADRQIVFQARMGVPEYPGSVRHDTFIRCGVLLVDPLVVSGNHDDIHIAYAS
jgi:hypothetical protein